MLSCPRLVRREAALLLGLLLMLLPAIQVAGAQSADQPATPTVPVRWSLEEVSFPSGPLNLVGFLVRPVGTGPFPAVLWNHGSERLPGPKLEAAAVFVQRGYAFFVPHRRGQGRSPGPYILDQLAEVQGTPQVFERQVQLLEEQTSDQLAALTYLKGLSFIDAQRIVVAGCSFGGIQALFGAEANVGYRAAVDFSGGAQSWGNPLLRDRMFRAVQAANIPIFLLQPQNDFTIEPTQLLGADLQRMGKPHQAKIYPPYGASPEEGHFGFCNRGGDVWGADVLAFLEAAIQGTP